MDEQSILTQLNEIFQDVFDDDDLQITPETSASDIEDWDSLANITLITIIEKQYHFRFELKDIPEMKNVGDLISVILERMS
ncbi:MAG: acyl carrier protein [Bacteroidales bacterium]|nr:acyl carrier protein [Bacteroidales bacterium]